MIGMTRRVEVFELFIFDNAKGIIVALTFLILHHAALIIQLLLRNPAEQMPHAVAFEEQRPVQRAGGHGLKIIGTIKPCGAIKIGCANLLERFKKIARRIFRAVEHQMLKQMRKAGFALWFVF